MNKKAYLLLEVLLAVSILSIGLTVIIRSFLSSSRAVVFVADYSRAVFLADNKMSDLLQEGSIADALSEEDSFPAPDDKFQYHLETVNIPEGGEKGFLNLIKLDVFWPSGKKTRNILLTTYLPNAPDEDRR